MMADERELYARRACVLDGVVYSVGDRIDCGSHAGGYVDSALKVGLLTADPPVVASPEVPPEFAAEPETAGLPAKLPRSVTAGLPVTEAELKEAEPTESELAKLDESKPARSQRGRKKK